ncbi:hypothetical protein GF373_13495 [bacterium]|nr:hypothetical protein [bacterium]
MNVRVDMEENLVPRIQTAVPATLYVNGKQVPPIEASGEIMNFSLTGIKIRCDQKIPIPSKGIIRFSSQDDLGPLEMKVEFVQRFEKSKGFLVWTSKKEYDMEATFRGNEKDEQERYQDYVHQFLFGSRKPVYSTIETNEPENVF